ncbi:unnamed protein product [Candida parapsilosis]
MTEGVQQEEEDIENSYPHHQDERKHNSSPRVLMSFFLGNRLHGREYRTMSELEANRLRN